MTWAIVILVWVFMIANYVVAAAIYFGFSAYRRKQGIDIESFRTYAVAITRLYLGA